MTEQAEQTRRGRLDGSKRYLLSAGAVCVVIALVVLVLALTGGDDDGGSEAAGSSSGASATEAAPTAAPTAAPEPTAAGSPEGGGGSAAPVPADQPPPSLAPVALDAEVAVRDVTGSLVLIEEIEGTALGVGNVNGPALRITVRLVNGGSDELSLSGVSVSTFYGTGRTPASPLEDRSRSPFSGSLPAGDAAEGVYVFSVPADQRDSITVEVGVAPGADVIVFSGAV